MTTRDDGRAAGPVSGAPAHTSIAVAASEQDRPQGIATRRLPVVPDERTRWLTPDPGPCPNCSFTLSPGRIAAWVSTLNDDDPEFIALRVALELRIGRAELRRAALDLHVGGWRSVQPAAAGVPQAPARCDDCHNRLTGSWEVAA